MTVIQSPFSRELAAASLSLDEPEAILASVAAEGALLFRDTGIEDASGFDALVQGFGLPPFTYQDSLSNAVRINRTDRVFTANEAPPDVEIFLHHELAQTPGSPRWLFFFCQSAAEAGGATPLCRSDRVFADLLSAAPEWAQQLETHGLRYTTLMPAGTNAVSGQGRSWHQTLAADSKAAAEARLHDLNYSWRWLDDDVLEATSPAVPAVKLLADGSRSLYTQIIAAARGWQNRERAIALGNGKPLPAGLTELVCTIAEKHTTDLAWQDFDVAIVDNWRVMHGRRPFSGERRREVLVAMAA